MSLHSASPFCRPCTPRMPCVRSRPMGSLFAPFLLVLFLLLGPVSHAVAGSAVAPLDSVTLARSINEFSFNLYRATESDPPAVNRFLSPFSVYGALLMAMEGAEARTAKEMGDVLQFPDGLYDRKSPDLPWEMESVHAGFRALCDNLSNAGFVAHADSLELELQIQEKQRQLDDLLSKGDRPGPDALGDSLGPQEIVVFPPVNRRRESSDIKLAREIRNLRNGMRLYELSIANGLWVDRQVSLQPRFRDTLKHVYNNPPRPLDFRNASAAAIDSINAWAREHTQGRIDKVAGAGSITPDTRVALANAVYFKGLWLNEFDKRSTRDGHFMTMAGDTVKARFMCQYESSFAYGRFHLKGGRMEPDPEWNSAPPRKHSGSVKLLVLPYRGRELEMWALLPQDPDMLPGLESRLGADILDACVTNLHTIALPVELPRFEFRQTVDLMPSFEPLGIQHPIRLTGIGIDSLTRSPMSLELNAALQSTFVQVNERGTEAAAVTLLALSESSSKRPRYQISFKADRPFLFLIRHRDTGTVLFIGRMGNPAEAVLHD